MFTSHKNIIALAYLSLVVCALHGEPENEQSATQCAIEASKIKTEQITYILCKAQAARRNANPNSGQYRAPKAFLTLYTNADSDAPPELKTFCDSIFRFKRQQ